MLGKERGQSLVELAVILPLLLFLFMGMIEVGWAMHSYLTVANAAREGARFGTRGSFSEEDIAEVTVVALGAVDVRLEGEEANGTVIVTLVDIDPDGSYTRHPSYTAGTLPVTSRLSDSEIAQIAQDNVAFNQDPFHCPLGSPPPCEIDSYNDLVVVEVFYEHAQMLGLPVVSDILPNPVQMYSRGLMRLGIPRYQEG